MNPIVIFAIQRLAILLGKLSVRDFKRICDWVQKEADANPDKPGWQKADAVLDKFSEFFGKMDKGVARTIIQLAYQFLKLRGVIA